MSTIVGKSKAAFIMICDALASQNPYQDIAIINNLAIEGEFHYKKFRLRETKLKGSPPYYLGAVMPVTKRKIVDALPFEYFTLINASAFIGWGYEDIGTGTVIDSLVSIAGGVTLGKYVTVYANSSIAHDSTLEDFVTICPNVSVCGNVKIGEGTFIGAGSVIKNGITIGKNCVIGCGSVVIHDVADSVTVYGNPAKEKKTGKQLLQNV